MEKRIQILEDKAAALIEATKRAGASDAEASLGYELSRSISIRGGEIEKSETSEGEHVSLRAYIGKKTAGISFSLASMDDPDALATRVVTMANASPEDPYCGIASPQQISHDAPIDLEQFDDADMLDTLELTKRAREIERIAESEPDILRADTTATGAGRYAGVFATSNGVLQHYKYSVTNQHTVLLSGDDERLERESAYDSRAFFADVESTEATAKRAAERARAARFPKRAPSGIYPVIFDERISSSLISHLLGAMNAASLARGTSFLREKLNEQILPSHISIKETPFRKRLLSSRQFDGEGLAKTERNWIDNGVLTGWYTDLSSAKMLGIEPTGNAGRSGNGTSPSIANLEVTGTRETKAEMLASVKDGLLVTGFIGATINPNTGDYSRGANGFWIRNGEIAEPVNEITIAINLMTMFEMMRLADDEDMRQSWLVPSIHVGDMTIAGA